MNQLLVRVLLIGLACFDGPVALLAQSNRSLDKPSLSIMARDDYAPQSVKVVCWNINRGLELERIIEFLGRCKADILLLQEADLNARRTHHLHIAREIAKRLRLDYVFGREFQELTQGTRQSPAYHGQATLSPWPLSAGSSQMRANATPG